MLAPTRVRHRAGLQCRCRWGACGCERSCTAPAGTLPGPAPLLAPSSCARGRAHPIHSHLRARWPAMRCVPQQCRSVVSAGGSARGCAGSRDAGAQGRTGTRARSRWCSCAETRARARWWWSWSTRPARRAWCARTRPLSGSMLSADGRWITPFAGVCTARAYCRDGASCSVWQGPCQVSVTWL